MKLRLLATLSALMLSRVAVEAGGFYVPEIGGRASSRAAAVVADDADPAATFHNPAGLASAHGLQLELATDLFFPQVTFFRRPLTDPNTGANLHFDGADNTNRVIAAPFAGASYQLDHRTTIGLAIYSPFGAALDFPDNGAQRQLVTSIALRTIFISPAIGLALPLGLSIGVAGNAIWSDFALHQRNALPYITGDPEQYPDPADGLEGTTLLSARDSFSAGATLGVGWHSFGGRVRAGASVMTPVTLHLNGTARVENAGISPLRDAQGNEQQPAGVRQDQIRISLPLPLVARAGVSVRVAPHTSVELDANWQRWSTFRSLRVDFVHEYELAPIPGAYLYDVDVETAWRDTWTARLGVDTTPWSPRLALRAGVLFDQSPIDDRHFAVLTPDSDKLGVTAGARWTRFVGSRQLDVEVAASHLFLRERDISPSMAGDPGSDGTILNKPAPSFFHGVTRAGFSVLTLAVAWRQ